MGLGKKFLTKPLKDPVQHVEILRYEEGVSSLGLSEFPPSFRDKGSTDPVSLRCYAASSGEIINEANDHG